MSMVMIGERKTKVFEVTLSEHEASTLLAVLYNVSGVNEPGTPRREMENLLKSLEASGVKHPCRGRILGYLELPRVLTPFTPKSLGAPLSYDPFSDLFLK